MHAAYSSEVFQTYSQASLTQLLWFFSVELHLHQCNSGTTLFTHLLALLGSLSLQLVGKVLCSRNHACVMHLGHISFVRSYAQCSPAANTALPGWQCWLAHSVHQKPVNFKNQKWVLCSCLWWSNLCCKSSCLALEAIMTQLREREAKTTWAYESASHSLVNTKQLLRDWVKPSLWKLALNYLWKPMSI